MKFAVLYHSESGNTKKVAELIAQSANGVEGVEARAMSIDAVDAAFVEASRVIALGCPTYAGSPSWHMKRYLDTMPLKLEGKLGSAFATENHIGGGADFAELTIIASLLVRGMLIYTGGAVEQPSTHFGAVSIKEGDEAQQARAKAFALKLVRKGLELFGE
jgi:NAD(P)H dehydrogenase (quinone)